MARIYFDSNVFSNLRNNKEEKYITLNSKLNGFKDNLTFIFSHAHIRDKINDTTDYKYLDFEFMESLVVDNYLSYHLLEKRTDFYLARPHEVFADNDSLQSVDYFMNIMGQSYKETRAFIENGTKEISQLREDSLYNLEGLFENGKIGDKFTDFVKKSLHHTDKSKIPYYDFYLHSYAMLDLLGFSKDKLNAKNSYNNVFNDSLHSYYARYCDYLVTEDEGFRKKSCLLYDKYECLTQILSVDEFLDKIDLIAEPTERSISDLIKKIASDLYSANIISKKEDSDSTVYILNPVKKYFNFFDCLCVLKTSPDEAHVFITKLDSHVQSSPNFRELEMITNRMNKIIGDDFYDKSNFDFTKEVEEIRNNNCEGRYWDLGDTRIHLQETEKTKQLCIQIGPLSKWPHLSKF